MGVVDGDAREGAAAAEASPGVAGLDTAKGTNISASGRLWDAELALLYSFHQGTFMKQAEDGTLIGEPLAELCNWTTFLTRMLPTIGSRAAVEPLRELACRKAAEGNGLQRSQWSEALGASKAFDLVPQEAGKDPSPHWLACKTYTCGLWSLLHILSLSAVDHDKRRIARVVLRRDPMPSPRESLERIHGFAVNFFGCQDCASHFSETYRECQLGRCNIDDAAGASLWLWQVHNSVTSRVAAEHQQQPPQPWPPRNECEQCWRDGWDNDAVLEHLRLTFWAPGWRELDADEGWEDHQMMVLLAASVAALASGYHALSLTRRVIARSAGVGWPWGRTLGTPGEAAACCGKEN